MISKYIKYLKRSPKHVQDYNLLLVSGVLTAIFAFLWLHFYYGFFKFDFYNDITISESQLRSAAGQQQASGIDDSHNASYQIESPIDQVINIFSESKDRFKDITLPTFGK